MHPARAYGGEGLIVRAFCPLLGNFTPSVQDCQAPVLNDTKFLQAVSGLVSSMQVYYDKEDGRKLALKDALINCMIAAKILPFVTGDIPQAPQEFDGGSPQMMNGWQLSEVKIPKMDAESSGEKPGKEPGEKSGKKKSKAGCKRTTDLCLGSVGAGSQELIIEVKNEQGTTNSSPELEVFSYYRNLDFSSRTTHGYERPNPALLMTVEGPRLTFYGAVTAVQPTKPVQFYFTEPLLTWSLTPTTDAQQHLLDTAKLIVALFQTLEGLRQFRMERGSNLTCPPCISDDSGDDSSDIFRVGSKLVFYQGSKLWKICSRYGSKAHFSAANLGIAPPLQKVEQLAPGTKMIRMQYLQGQMLYETGVEHDWGAWKEFREQFKKFSAKYVHGDLREPNILLVKEETGAHYYIIDFDWSAEHSESARYPPNLNCEVFGKIDGVAPCALMTSEHDEAFLDHLEGVFFERKNREWVVREVSPSRSTNPPKGETLVSSSSSSLKDSRMK